VVPFDFGLQELSNPKLNAEVPDSLSKFPTTAMLPLCKATDACDCTPHAYNPKANALEVGSSGGPLSVADDTGSNVYGILPAITDLSVGDVLSNGGRVVQEAVLSLLDAIYELPRPRYDKGNA
jgi:hypothetical protein